MNHEKAERPSVEDRLDAMMSLLATGFHNNDTNFRELKARVDTLDMKVEQLDKRFDKVEFKIEFLTGEVAKIDKVIR